MPKDDGFFEGSYSDIPVGIDATYAKVELVSTLSADCCDGYLNRNYAALAELEIYVDGENDHER